MLDSFGGKEMHRTSFFEHEMVFKNANRRIMDEVNNI